MVVEEGGLYGGGWVCIVGILVYMVGNSMVELGCVWWGLLGGVEFL